MSEIILIFAPTVEIASILRILIPILGRKAYLGLNCPTPSQENKGY